MLAGLTMALGWQRAPKAIAALHRVATVAMAPAARDNDLQQPTPDDDACLPTSSQRAIPTIQARPAGDHAAALLAWLQGAGGRSGSILASELENMHRDLCHELDWELVGWVAVGRELRRILGTRKEYTRRAGRQLCVYRIPPANIAPSAREWSRAA